jgi:hypothetical protein
MAGLIFIRYVLLVDPIATMPADEVVTLLAPGVTAPLFGIS